MTTEQLIAELESELAQIQAAIALAEKQQKGKIDDGQGNIDIERGKLETLYKERRRIREDLIALGAGGESQANFRAREMASGRTCLRSW